MIKKWQNIFYLSGFDRRLELLLIGYKMEILDTSREGLVPLGIVFLESEHPLLLDTALEHILNTFVEMLLSLEGS